METKFTPIAMRCNKEQFEAIKPKFKNTKWKVLSDIMVDFKVDAYLVNNYKKNKIVNIHETCKANRGRTVYEKWNEATFLRACGIEVDEPITVSKEFILDFHNKVIWPSVRSKIEKEFPQLFESKLEVGRWYKSPEFGSSLFCVTKINRDYATAYGFNFIGKWQDKKDKFASSNLENKTLATPEEVETALINEAKKRGFKEGLKGFIDQDLNKNTNKKLMFSHLSFDEDYNWLCDGHGNVIFKNGKWATIIDQTTEMTLEQRVSKLEEQIKNLK
jgi:hypothetical protein